MNGIFSELRILLNLSEHEEEEVYRKNIIEYLVARSYGNKILRLKGGMGIIDGYCFNEQGIEVKTYNENTPIEKRNKTETIPWSYIPDIYLGQMFFIFKIIKQERR